MHTDSGYGVAWTHKPATLPHSRCGCTISACFLQRILTLASSAAIPTDTKTGVLNTDGSMQVKLESVSNWFFQWYTIKMASRLTDGPFDREVAMLILSAVYYFHCSAAFKATSRNSPLVFRVTYYVMPCSWLTLTPTSDLHDLDFWTSLKCDDDGRRFYQSVFKYTGIRRRAESIF